MHSCPSLLPWLSGNLTCHLSPFQPLHSAWTPTRTTFNAPLSPCISVPPCFAAHHLPVGKPQGKWAPTGASSTGTVLCPGLHAWRRAVCSPGQQLGHLLDLGLGAAGACSEGATSVPSCLGLLCPLGTSLSPGTCQTSPAVVAFHTRRRHRWTLGRRAMCFLCRCHVSVKPPCVASAGPALRPCIAILTHRRWPAWSRGASSGHSPLLFLC